ncbi:MAG: SDR family NAD(P)-dependent oxidoreductase, partial [Cycloclasticus sp.]|nr:SDR family NAD(P)-dependent oxidoreductase [Cycloclasticus sp.]
MNKPISSFDHPKNHLKDHVYLITGATGGLGRETSLALAKLGATVILTARNEHKLDALYDQIEQEG